MPNRIDEADLNWDELLIKRIKWEDCARFERLEGVEAVEAVEAVEFAASLQERTSIQANLASCLCALISCAPALCQVQAPAKITQGSLLSRNSQTRSLRHTAQWLGLSASLFVSLTLQANISSLEATRAGHLLSQSRSKTYPASHEMSFSQNKPVVLISARRRRRCRRRRRHRFLTSTPGQALLFVRVSRLN